MPLNSSFGNYARRRIDDASANRGDRLRDMVNQAASHPNVAQGNTNQDQRNRANASANRGSYTTGRIDPEAKVTVSTRGGNATANASGSNVRKGDVPAGANIQIDASGRNATANASGRNGGGGGRSPVSFATYASQREPLRSPAPTHNIPGYNAAVGDWRNTVDQILNARNQHHADAGATHDERMREYNDAINRASRGGDRHPNQVARYRERKRADKGERGPNRDNTTPSSGGPGVTYPENPTRPGGPAVGTPEGPSRHDGRGGGRDRVTGHMPRWNPYPMPRPVPQTPAVPPPQAATPPQTQYPGWHYGQPDHMGELFQTWESSPEAGQISFEDWLHQKFGYV